MSEEQMNNLNIQPPTFVAPLSQSTEHAVQTRGTPATLNLDDIFGDCFFTPDGDQIFLSENPGALDGSVQTSGEQVVSTNASRPNESDTKSYIQVPFAGGISTTGLNQTGTVRATTMGPAATNQEQKILPMAQPPQQRHHLQYAMVNTHTKRRANTGGRDRKMSDQQKSERR